jgi:hypothetical protein
MSKQTRPKQCYPSDLTDKQWELLAPYDTHRLHAPYRFLGLGIIGRIMFRRVSRVYSNLNLTNLTISGFGDYC